MIKKKKSAMTITLRKHLLGVIDHRFHILMKGCQCCTVVFLTAIIYHHYSLVMVEAVVLVSSSSGGGGSRSSGGGSGINGVGGSSR